ncbi:exopolyphosphatase [Metabacillus malikii]|uniref:exopolyphosphatase n=1 Tax=Metabacillus malikii TaxID=1504265 RepID=A0ABT9ZB80_9BACI|nr:exopolyphosphatase [Metabacillus malikii]MDQ0229525.1 exopolyphosphatase/guanosine-5'-triphosphate,3'-diphosphate pyrophosphatase [Metabacillus malikii]
MEQDKYGIVDIGSNTMRLVIYLREKSGRLKEIENVKAVARLRNYLTDDRVLEAKGVNLLIETLQTFQEVTRHYELSDVKCVATATVRQAINQQEVIKRVSEETDFTIRVLSEYEEAYYGYLAVVNSTSIESGITIDIGGGSTEITFFKNRQLVNHISFPFGALSLRKQFVQDETPTEEEIEAIRLFLDEQFKTLDWIRNKCLPVIGIGGSARNLVQVHQEYINYPLSGVHQYMMNAADVQLMSTYLQSLSFDDLQRVEGLAKDRADLIIPAIEVFKMIMDIVQTDKFVLSRKGLRDGVFYEEITKDFGFPYFPNVIEESFYELATDYQINVNQVFYVTKCALIIYEHLNKLGLVTITREDKLLLRRGTYVFNIGNYIDSESSSKHTFYLLTNRTIDGLMHRERMIIALIASFTNKSSFKQNVTLFSQWFTKDELTKYRLLGSIIKFAYSLNATNRNIIERINLELQDEETLIFSIKCRKDWKPEQYQVEKQKKHLEKVLKKTITVKFHF